MQGSGNQGRWHVAGSIAGEPGSAWLDAMRRADWRAAWAINDAVLAARDTSHRDDPSLPYHRRWVWDGRRFEGRDVLVRCYHGLGDTLQFARYLAPLRACVRSLALEAPPALMPLLRLLPGPDRLIPFDPSAPAPPADCDLEIMELPHALRLPPQDVPLPPIPVCPAVLPPALALCWAAGDWNPARSVPLPTLLPALPPGPLLSLQRGLAAREATAPAFLNPGDADADVLRSAALLLAAPLVVTVDTMVAHLAGLLGRPTCLLLPYEADWRWNVPWYPRHRLFRQAAPRDWHAPLAALSAALSSAGRATAAD